MNKAEKLRKQFEREVLRLQRIVKEQEKKGFTFSISPIPQTPVNVTKKDVEAIRKVTPEYLRNLGVQNKQVDIQQIKQEQKQKAIQLRNVKKQAKARLKGKSSGDGKDELDQLKAEHKRTKEKIAEMKSDIDNMKKAAAELIDKVSESNAELQYLKNIGRNVFDTTMNSAQGPISEIESYDIELGEIQRKLEMLDIDEEDPIRDELETRFMEILDKINERANILVETVKSSTEALKALNKEYDDLSAQIMPKVQQLTEIQKAVEEKTKNIDNEQKRIFTNIISELITYLRSALMKDIENEVYVLFMREFEAFIKYASVEEILRNIEKFEIAEGITFAQNGGESFYSSDQEEMMEMAEVLFKIIYPAGVPSQIKQQLDEITERQAAKNLAMYNKWNEERRRNKLKRQNNTSRKRN